MAEATLEQENEQDEVDNLENVEETQEEVQGSKLSFLTDKKFKIIGIVIAVMLLEAVGMYCLLPSPSVASDDSNGSVVTDENGNSTAEDALETQEVNVDKFNTSNSLAVPGSVLHVSFTLVAIVSKNNVQPFKDNVLNEKKSRVKQAVIKVVRSASIDDLNDPELGTITRLIREEINKVLGKSYVTGVVIPDFRAMEQ